MRKISKLLIIIPAYNEGANIGNVLAALSNYDILVIDDCSTDNTVQVSENAGATVITNFQHLGYGGGLQVGYRYALKHHYNYVIQIDADGQHDPCNVDVIYKRLLAEDKPDVVLGSRFLPGSHSFKIGGFKKMAIKYLNIIINKVSKKRFTDSTTGLQGLTTAVVYYYSRYKQFDGKYPDGNVLLEAACAGFKIVEVPAVMHARESGESMHNGVKPIYYMMHMTLALLSVARRKDINLRYKKARQYELTTKQSCLDK